MNRNSLRGESIYSIYIRNFSKEGNFQGLIERLAEIKELGATIIWILPHYPIGQKDRKGTLGSPYSISDYKSVNPELGTMDDFNNLLTKAHALGLKVIIDIVFNHTSKDSLLLKNNPEWFLVEDEEITGKVQSWSDVIDLDYSNIKLWDELIDVLKYWAKVGVDGFRCDVASVVPIKFWEKARKETSIINKNLIWLAESVDKEFISFIRHKGYNCNSDSELYNAFDILYDYDIQGVLEDYINGKDNFASLVKELRNQEVVYPMDYLKLRFLENHDSRGRIASIFKKESLLKNWKSFSMFQKGVPLIYNGEEYRIKDHPDLFNKDSIIWQKGDNEYREFIKRLLDINKLEIVTKGIYTINPIIEDCLHLRFRHKGKTLHGVFNFGTKGRIIPFETLEGEYLNLISLENFKITSKGLKLNRAPYIFESIP